MARQVQEHGAEPQKVVSAQHPQDSSNSTDDDMDEADKHLASMGYAPVSLLVPRCAYRCVHRPRRVTRTAYTDIMS